MTEIPTAQPPIYNELLEKAEKEGSVTAALTMSDLHKLFVRQTELDTSGDLPELRPGFQAEIKDGVFHLLARYFIDADKKELTFEGTAKNNEEGVLTDEKRLEIYPESLKARVFEAFGVKEQLELPHFVKLLIEDALEGKVEVEKLWVEGEKLGIALSSRRQIQT